MSTVPSVLLPAACFPDIEFFCWLTHAPEVTIEINETYPRQTCRNRYNIATANGILTLSVPVNKPNGNHTPTAIVQTAKTGNWNTIHWRALESAYNKSPYFLYYRDYFEVLFANPADLLIDFNRNLMETCLNLLKLPVNIKYTQTYSKEPDNMMDMRRRIMPKRNEPHPWSISVFEPYVQAFSEKYDFLPNLSIADLLFNLGPEALQYLRRHQPGK